jgi:hypothetical protein
VLAERTGVVVNVMMVTRHAPCINALLRRLNPAADRARGRAALDFWGEMT